MSDIVVVPVGEALSLAPTSPAFAHGFGLFETMRYGQGKLYFWKEHWARLSRSAKHFALVLPKADEVLAALRQLVSEAGLSEGTLKLSLVKENEGSRLYVYTRPAFPEAASRTLQLDTTSPIFSRSTLAGHKTHNYMESMYLLQLARAQGYYDTLRTDSDGNLAETTTANLFFVRSGKVCTPSVETGILPGVIRSTLVRSRELGIEEGLYPPEALWEADSVFLTNATGGVMCIEKIVGFSGGESADLATSCDALDSIRSVLVRAEEECAEQLI